MKTDNLPNTRAAILKAGTSLGGVTGAFADEGDKNEEISDSGKKMDALMDMMADACAKMDEGGKRLDARMDAMEENFRRQDARMDAMSKADAEEEEKKEESKADAEEEEKGDPKQVAADRKDSEEEEKKEEAKADASKKDEDEPEKKGEAEADNTQFMTRADAEALQAQIKALQSRAPAIISDADRERFASIQEQADPVFQAFGDRAPGPLDGETPTSYKRRLGAKLQGHSPKWKDARLSSISDEAVLDTVLSDVYADSMTAARQGGAVPAGALREISRQSGGHIINEFFGTTDAWVNQFAGNSQRATGDWRRPN